MEALVRGLTAELLDLKKVAMGISRQDGEREPPGPEEGNGCTGHYRAGTGRSVGIPITRSSPCR